MKYVSPSGWHGWPHAYLCTHSLISVGDFGLGAVTTGDTQGVDPVTSSMMSWVLEWFEFILNLLLDVEGYSVMRLFDWLHLLIAVQLYLHALAFSNLRPEKVLEFTDAWWCAVHEDMVDLQKSKVYSSLITE